MKKSERTLAAAVLFFALTVGVCALPVQAKEPDAVADGIYIGAVDVSGLLSSEAEQAVSEYTDGLKERTITMNAVEDNQVAVTAGDLGLTWSNPGIVEEAVEFGKTGNVVQRYKAIKDLQHENKVFELQLDFDKELIRQVLEEQCTSFDVEAVDASLVKNGDSFSVTPGQTGYVVDVEASLEQVYQFLLQEWNREDVVIELTVSVDEPQGSEEELSAVRDVLGTCTTSFKTSGKARTANVTNGCILIAGTTVYPDEEFSTYKAVSPFSEANGYYMAGSYLNGQVVDSLGGGICQVSTTLYNSVLMSELEVTERHNHSMIVNYVEPSADAAIAESAGKDFKFVNNTGYPIYIDGYVQDKNITFTIYGVETRPAGRTVSYESEVLSVTNPDSETVYTNAGMPIGQVSVQSAHIGYKARLWKVVTENGAEVSREQVNSSSYKMVPRTATVGIATNDVNAYNAIMAAVATNNIDNIKNVAATLTAFAPQPGEVVQLPAPPAAEQPAVPAEQPAAPAEQPAVPAEQPAAPAEQSAAPAE